MKSKLSGSYLPSLVVLTAVLVTDVSFNMFVTVISYLVTAAILARIMVPKYRKSVFYRILLLFDLTTFVQVIRKKMIHVGKARRAALVGGTLFYFVSVYETLILFTSGLYLMNIDNGIVSYIPPIYREISVASVFVLSALAFTFTVSVFLVGFGYYAKFTNWESVIHLAQTLHPEYGKSKHVETPHPWQFMNRTQKVSCVAINVVGISLLMFEFYALGFIMSPAQTFATTLEPKFMALVLDTFGTFTNALLAEVGVLCSIGLTMWGMMRLGRRIENQAVGFDLHDKRL